MTTPDSSIESILAAAVELATPDERQAYIAQACGGDTELQKRVEQMLDNYFQAGSFLETPAPGLPKTIAYPQETVGKMVGPYKLLEKLGEGGMGTVWIAEREKPVRQRVALKLIKPGMDSAQVLRRFEAERQALALMSHHNIARMLDAGSTEAGRPYFVMELVKGVPITRYCDEVHASIEKRLQLFIPVCLAVQHAHQKGIIHRDIKPSNVLVCMEDGKPVPKVIDFGVAKALYQPLTEGTLHTAFNQVVGTLEYMSPEQAELNALDIDTRADIYALGVLLFELLTGTTPITREELKTLALMGMLRKIKESEPKKPSTRLSESKDTLASVAASRRSDPRRLMKEIAGDLDWIVLKCLEPDRMRRYETANALAREIERHLVNEPVEARAPSRAYRLKKFMVRNRWAVAATIMILLALLTGVIGLAWGLRVAEQGRQLAEQKEGEAKQALEKEAREREYAQAIVDFVKDDFLALTSVEGQERFGEGSEALGKNATLRELLDRAANKLDKRKGLDPRIEEELRWIIGVSYRYLGEVNRALINLERCVELLNRQNSGDEEKMIATRNSLAVAYSEAGKHEKALAIFEEVFKQRNKIFGPVHPETLASMNNLASAYLEAGKTDLALPLVDKVLKHRKTSLGDDHRDTLTSMHNLGSVYVAEMKYDLAIPILEESLKLRKAKLGDNHFDTLNSMAVMAYAYLATNKIALAVPLLEETLKLRKAKLGEDHLHTLNSMHDLAHAYRKMGKVENAISLLEKTLKFRKAKLGDDHRATLTNMHGLALVYKDVGKLDQALPLIEKTHKHHMEKLGADHNDTHVSMDTLASIYMEMGKLDLALPLLEKCLKYSKTKWGPDHLQTITSMNNLATCYLYSGKLDEALPLLEESLKSRKVKLGVDHPETLMSMNNLALAYKKAGKHDIALTLYLEATRKAEKINFQFNNAEIILSNLIVILENQKQFDQAAGWRQKWISVMKSRSGADSLPYANQLAPLSLNLLLQKKWSEAESILRDCLTIRENKQPDAWSTFNTKSMLGAALLGQKKYNEAETLLLKGYEGMKLREMTIPLQAKDRLPEALERLIQLYEQTNKPVEVAKWKAELEQVKARLEQVKTAAKPENPSQKK